MQLDKVLYKWLTEMHFEGIPMTGPMVIKRAESFYNEMEITDGCEFFEGELQNFKEPEAKGDTSVEYYCNWLCSPSLGAMRKKLLGRT
jgi:hypothetical protein